MLCKDGKFGAEKTGGWKSGVTMTGHGVARFGYSTFQPCKMVVGEFVECTCFIFVKLWELTRRYFSLYTIRSWYLFKGIPQ